jgi:hypothetical protein
MGVVLDFLAWLCRKVGTGLLLAIVAFTVLMAWIWVREQGFLEQERLIRLQSLQVEQKRIETALTEAGTKLGEFRDAFEEQRVRAERLDRIIANLSALQDWWNFLFGDPEQNRLNREQLERAKTNQQSTQLMIEELSLKVEQTLGVQLDLVARRDAIVQELLNEESPTGLYHYVRTAWARAKWTIAILLVSYFFGPTVVKVLAYFGVGRLLVRSKPIVLRKEPRLMPEVTSGGVSLEVELWPGEAAWVKEQFLQSSDEGLERRTRFLFDWAIPLTSLSCGLVELVELSLRRAGESLTVTLSDMDDPHNELALVRVPDGGSIVLRPSYIAAVIKPLGGTLVVRRRWRLFHWQSWITGQFRFFEFEGPVKLAVVGSRGVRAEWLRPKADGSHRARRTNQDATIGFTPNLRYRPVRAETFWAYYRDKNPLFDDLFEGEGVFLCQEIVGEGGAGKKLRNFWSRAWDAVLKVFGI